MRRLEPGEGGALASQAYLQLLFAVEVVEEVVKVDLRHLLEQREEAGNVLPLHAGEKTKTFTGRLYKVELGSTAQQPLPANQGQRVANRAIQPKGS